MRDEGVTYVAGHPLLNRRCTRLPGCIRLRNDLYCVEWGVKLYSLTHSPEQCWHASLLQEHDKVTTLSFIGNGPDQLDILNVICLYKHLGLCMFVCCAETTLWCCGSLNMEQQLPALEVPVLHITTQQGCIVKEYTLFLKTSAL